MHRNNAPDPAFLSPPVQQQNGLVPEVREGAWLSANARANRAAPRVASGSEMPD